MPSLIEHLHIVINAGKSGLYVLHEMADISQTNDGDETNRTLYRPNWRKQQVNLTWTYISKLKWPVDTDNESITIRPNKLNTGEAILT